MPAQMTKTTKTSPLPTPRKIRKKLLHWYDRHQRDLPWRHTQDPWAILVSEVMLQQTSVAVAIPYWNRFLDRWPDPQSLSRASLDEVLSMWAGLGYYRRAHYLMETAKAITAAGGDIPHDSATLRQLPGIGAYTAAAVSSIAYQEPVPAVDGNVERVITRLSALRGNPRQGAPRHFVQRTASELLDPNRPGDFNQAMMELGATLCRPKSPDCRLCPLSDHCQAHALGTPTRFPELPRRQPLIRRVFLAGIAQRGSRVLMTQRHSSPNEGFHELPSREVDLSGPESDHLDSPHLLVMHMRTLGLEVTCKDPLPPHRHTITTSKITLLPWRVNIQSGRVKRPLQWINTASPDLPMTTATRRILEKIDGQVPSPR